MRRVVILGLTGSIGTTALRGCLLYNEEIQIVAASCHSNVDKALDICIKYNIKNLCVTMPGYKNSNKSCGITIWTDIGLMLDYIKCDVVLNGIAGCAGLWASVEVVRRSLTLALANKETIVLGGNLFLEEARHFNSKVIPVDSEHSAIDELIKTNGIDNIQKLIITASGGPYLNKKIEELNYVTPEEAANHPTWKMGKKISIDSSNLANKGLEVIEAHYLFGFDADNIEVVIHPKSIVHSMIRTTSGQVYAQLSNPDMVFPIMRALLNRHFTKPLDEGLSFECLNLSFSKVNFSRFPLLNDAYTCIRRGSIWPVVYNTADEIAVKAFIDGKIRYNDINTVVHKALSLKYNTNINKIEDIRILQEEVEKTLVI